MEKRAFRMARFALDSDDQALDCVQDAMLEFVRRYRDKPEQEWPPLFYRVLQSKTTDAHRRRSVRQRFMGWLGLAADDDDSDPIQNVPDPRDASPLRLLEQAQLGVQSGALTPKEAGRLEAQQARIAQEEARMKADGNLTKAERAKLTHDQNRASKAIYRKKHNNRTANTH